MNILRYYYFLFFFLGYSHELIGAKNTADSLLRQAQNLNISDSLRFEAFTNYYVQYHQQFPDTALLYSKYHLKLAQKVDNQKEQFKAYLELGNVLRLQQHYKEALREYQHAQHLAENSNNDIMKADVFHNMGTVWVYQKDYTQAMNFYYEALDLYEKANDRPHIKTVLNSMANVFLLIRNFDMAIAQYQYILRLQEKDKLKDITTGIAFSNLGWAYYKTAEYKKARNYYLKALPIYTQKSNLFLIMSAYLDLSRIYLAMNQHDTALVYANRSIQLSKKLRAEESLIESLLERGKIYFSSNPQKALTEILPIQQRIDRLGNLDLKTDLYLLLYRCYKHLGNTQKALFMHEQYQYYNDSIQKQYFQFEIVQEAIKRALQKQLDAARLANQKHLDALAMKQLKINFGILTGSSILLGTLLWILGRNKRLSQRKREELLSQIVELKRSQSSEILLNSNAFKLKRDLIEAHIQRKLNETDWKVLNILLVDASISNRDIAEKAFLSVEGIGSSLRRMYEYFDVKESKYKKIGLITQAIKISKQ